MLKKIIAVMVFLFVFAAVSGCTQNPDNPSQSTADSSDSSSQATDTPDDNSFYESPPEEEESEEEESAPEPLDIIELTDEESAELMQPNSEGIVEISSAEALYAFSMTVNSQSAQADKYLLTKSIDMSGYDFTPIGTEGSEFIGTFDGGGNIIRNLTIRDASNPQATGFFGIISENSTVKNLHLTEANISGENNVGGISGINRGTIEDCSFRGNISAQASSSGGITGSLEGASILRCAANANVSGPAEIGGLCGKMTGESAITDSYSLGSVTILPSEKITAKLLGGFIGDNESGTIKNCYAVTEVYAKTPVNVAGAFAGYSAGEIISCYYKSESVSNWKDIGDTGGELPKDITGCTVELITEQKTFLNWDFNSVWGIAENKNRGLPFLKSISG